MDVCGGDGFSSLINDGVVDTRHRGVLVLLSRIYAPVLAQFVLFREEHALIIALLTKTYIQAEKHSKKCCVGCFDDMVRTL